MDADHSPAPQSVPARGGTIEAVGRTIMAKEPLQKPKERPAERYELRDPFAEATYHARTLTQMIAKAEQLNSGRFVAVTEDGKRTPIQKVDGEWQRTPQRPAATDARETPSQPARTDYKGIAAADAQTERAARVASLEAGLMDRYVIKHAAVTVGDATIGRTEYRFRGDTSRVAFTGSTFRLATDINNPSVARSMIDVAETRNWKALRVSGNEDFKRMVWLEAAVRGVKTLGYEANAGDLELLKREREARLINRIEPARIAESSPGATAPADKPSARGAGGRKAVLAAIEAVLVARKVPEKQREAVIAAATEKLAQRFRDGQVPKVKVYDITAPSQRHLVVPNPDMQRARDRTEPAPTR